MTVVTNQSTSETTAGDILIKARRTARLKRSDAAERLRLDAALLKAFDEWNFESVDLRELNEPAYISLRRYARLLGVAPAGLERQLPAELRPKATARRHTRRFLFISRVGYLTVAGAVVLAFLGFLTWRTIRANAIPELTITSPEQNAIVEVSRINITGHTNEGAQVFINGQTVPVETNGEFSGSVILQSGPNRIEIRAINSFAREHTIERVVVRQ